MKCRRGLVVICMIWIMRLLCLVSGWCTPRLMHHRVDMPHVRILHPTCMLSHGAPNNSVWLPHINPTKSCRVEAQIITAPVQIINILIQLDIMYTHKHDAVAFVIEPEAQWFYGRVLYAALISSLLYSSPGCRKWVRSCLGNIQCWYSINYDMNLPSQQSRLVIRNFTTQILYHLWLFLTICLTRFVDKEHHQHNVLDVKNPWC